MIRYNLYRHANGISFDKVTKEDLSSLLELKNESWETTHNISLLNIENQLAWYEAICKEDIHTPKNLILMASAETTSVVKVGVFKLFHIDWYNMKADAAWDVFAEFRNHGLGKKVSQAGVDFAKDVLGLRKLNAEILENNPASMKCALAAGFEQEGVKKEEVLRQGKFLNSHVMGLFTSRLKASS